MPTDIANKSAIITNIIDGGIKIPKVPDAAIVPVAKIYHTFSLTLLVMLIGHHYY